MRSLLVLMVALAMGCEGDGSGGGGGSGTAALGVFCAAGDDDWCASGLCRDVVRGQASTSYSSTDFDTSANEGYICTVSCDTTADCAGLSFPASNGYSFDSEEWSCTGGVCGVTLSDGGGALSECDRCRRTCSGQGSWCQCDDECG